MRPFHILLALIAVAMIGGNFVAGKMAVQTLPPYYFLMWRFALAAAILAPFLREMPMKMRDMLPLSLLFSLNFSLGTLAMARGLSIPTTVIITQLMVPFSCLLSAWLLRDHIGPWRWLGMALAFVGCALVVGNPSASENPGALGIALASAMAGGIFTVAIKRYGAHSIGFIAWMSLLSVPQLAFISWVMEYPAWVSPVTFAPHIFACIAYSAIFSTIIAHGILFYLLKMTPVSATAPFTLLAPVFGLGFGQWFFHEPMPHNMVIGGVLTLLGVGIIVIRRPKLAAREQG